MGLDERSKGNYQPWNQESFHADMNVQYMSAVQRWMYRTLLQEAWVCSTRPRLPNDDNKLWKYAGCENKQQWIDNKEALLECFEQVDIDGELLLQHGKLERDWENLVNKRIQSSEAGKKSAANRKRKSTTVERPLNDPSTDDERSSTSKVKKSKEELKQSESTEEDFDENEDSDFDHGQGEDDLNKKGFIKDIKGVMRAALKSDGDLSANQEERFTDLQAEYSSYAVINDFREWAMERRHDELRNPAAVYLNEAYDRLAAPAQQVAVKDNQEVKHIAREIAYLSDNSVVLDTKQKALLAETLSAEGYTAEEAIGAFKEFYATIQGDEYAMRFAGKNFVEKADGLIYTAKRRKQESAEQVQKMDEARVRIEEQAARERDAALAAAEQDEDLVEDTLGE